MGAPMIIFRLDATSKIGSGHAMRCRAIARALEDAGAGASFAVATRESAEFLRALGCDARVLGGDPMLLTKDDGLALACLAEKEAAGAVFVDTYGVTDAFFEGLQSGNFRIAYLDDLYTFEFGKTDAPLHRPVDLVLNYSFYADESSYRDIYGRGTYMLLGPRYAPLGEGFIGRRARAADVVQDILVTTGSTNPDHVLERMARACLDACDANIHVVVGPKASFGIEGLELSESETGRLVLLHDVHNMANLMQRCDMAVTAGGTTLYELCSMRMPTIAIPIVENQQKNVEGFVALGLGVALEQDAPETELASVIGVMASNPDDRRKYASRMGEVVDGKGSHILANELAQLA